MLKNILEMHSKIFGRKIKYFSSLKKIKKKSKKGHALLE